MKSMPLGAYHFLLVHPRLLSFRLSSTFMYHDCSSLLIPGLLAVQLDN